MIDEIKIFIMPVVLGSGIPLTSRLKTTINPHVIGKTKGQTQQLQFQNK